MLASKYELDTTTQYCYYNF